MQAADGLRIVDAAGNAAAGTLRRADATGLIRIVGNQTLAAGQTLQLTLAGDHQSDQLLVTGTLSLATGQLLTDSNSPALAIVRSAGDALYRPKLNDAFDLITAGQITGRFGQATGLFGYSAQRSTDPTDFNSGSLLMQMNAVGTQGLGLSVISRPVADLVAIQAHSQSDANRLGMFFNPEYFVSQPSFNVGMTLTTSDFLTVDGVFQVSNTLVPSLKLSDGKTVEARRWVIGASHLDAFVGLNGPYLIDSNHNGSLNDETPNRSAAGFQLTGVDLAMAVYFERPAAPVNGAAAAVARGWVSLKATSESATEVGLPLIKMDASNLAVAVNLGTDAKTVVDYSGAPLLVVTGDVTVASAGNPSVAKNLTLDFNGTNGTFVRASGDFKLQIADFFYASGSLGFEKSTQNLVLAD
ncbi:MAG: hypothetical protein EBY28_25120, partial [Betaproteobacteria bacterium]|nr:hypothetical protein [Betaproteobacteria bacterium]